jgi:hypothetical protein
MRRITSRLTYANVVASLALFIALGGGAYAATKLPKNSVGNTQLKDDAVDGDKVDDGSLTAKDFKKSSLPKGDRGPAGAVGATGPQGSAGSTGQAGEKGDKGETGPQGPGATVLEKTVTMWSGGNPRLPAAPDETIATIDGVRFYARCGFDAVALNDTIGLVVVGVEPATTDGTPLALDATSSGAQPGVATTTKVLHFADTASHEVLQNVASLDGTVRAGSGRTLLFRLAGAGPSQIQFFQGQTCSFTGMVIPAG